MSYPLSPPEITSLQMYTGPGSGPMLAAASSWQGLASELGSAAASFSSVTGGLPWQGAAAQAMTSVATKYVQWLGAAATQAGGAASQANATAGIFEAAKAAVTHPAAVAINRQQLVQLVKTNLFGFNCPLIAEVEGIYEGMWAKNVGALAGYHSAASAVAAQLTPWAQALQSLPAAAQSAGGAIVANTKANVADASAANASDLARGSALSSRKITQAKQVLTGQEREAAAVSPAQRVVQAGRLVAEAGAIDAGTGVRVATRMAAVAPLSAAQAGDIVGGAGPLKSIEYEEFARAAAVNPLLQTGDGPGQTASAYNQAQLADTSRLAAYQTATTKQLTAQHLENARAALSGRQAEAAGIPSMDGLRTATREVAEAAALNVGTGAQVGLEKAFLAPTLLGADLDILGGGDELLYPEEYY